MRIMETKVFTFEELSDEAKQKALEANYDINVDHYWYFDEYLEDLAKEYGIAAKCNDMCFELDRGAYFYLDIHDHAGQNDNYGVSHIEDAKQYLKACGYDLRSREAREYIDNGLQLDTIHYGGGEGRNEVLDTEGNSDELLNTAINEFCEKALAYLRDQYEYLTSEEAISDTLIANEYEFTAEGVMV